MTTDPDTPDTGYDRVTARDIAGLLHHLADIRCAATTPSADPDRRAAFLSRKAELFTRIALDAERTRIDNYSRQVRQMAADAHAAAQRERRQLPQQQMGPDPRRTASLPLTADGPDQRTPGPVLVDTAKNAELTLREFVLLVCAEHTSVVCVADLQRRHVERYKRWLLERPAARGGPLHRHTVRDRLSKLRGFFRRLDEWDAEDRPARQLVFDSDFPIADEPLPRFFDDAAAAKLLAAARNDPEPFARLAIEILARTGMRRSEMLGLTIDTGGADRLRLLAAGPGREDAHRPLRPAAPAAEDSAG